MPPSQTRALHPRSRISLSLLLPLLFTFISLSSPSVNATNPRLAFVAAQTQATPHTRTEGNSLLSRRSTNPHLTVGAIVGIIIGALILKILLLVGIYVVVRRRTGKARKTKEQRILEYVQRYGEQKPQRQEVPGEGEGDEEETLPRLNRGQGGESSASDGVNGVDIRNVAARP